MHFSSNNGQRIASGTLLCGIVALALTGCGNNAGLQPVKGKVAYKDGKPVEGGSITFNNSQKQISASGDIATDGTFTLSFGTNKGAPAGTYSVTVTGNSEYGQPATVANIYGDPSRTPLKQEIVDGANDLTIEVDRPKK